VDRLDDQAGGRHGGNATRTYFWIDRKKNVAGVWMTQVLPFVDAKALSQFLAFEKAVYQTLG
jgi:hypothetical protein